MVKGRTDYCPDCVAVTSVLRKCKTLAAEDPHLQEDSVALQPSFQFGIADVWRDAPDVHVRVCGIRLIGDTCMIDQCHMHGRSVTNALSVGATCAHA